MNKKVITKRRKVCHDFMTPNEKKKHRVSKYLETIETTETIEDDFLNDDNSSNNKPNEEIPTVPIGKLSEDKPPLNNNFDYQKLGTILGIIATVLAIVGYFIYLHVQTSSNSTNIQNIKDTIVEIKDVNKNQDSLIIDLIKGIKK